MKVLSYCDGMSCGQIALKQLGASVKEYYASEIKEDAMKVTLESFPETKYLGDLTKLTDYDLRGLGGIDLFIGGMPCKDLSAANKERLGLKGEKSKLFYNFAHAISVVKPKYFFFENVKMPKEDMEIITSMLGVQPVRINSKNFTAQLRDRYYWTNIPNDLDEQRVYNDVQLQDILTSGYTDRSKSRCLLESDSRPLSTPVKMFHRYYSSGFTTLIFKSKEHYEECKEHYDNNFKGMSAKDIEYDGTVYDGVRYLNKQERELLQGVPLGHTKSITSNQSAGLLGDGWTVPVIKEFFEFFAQ